MDILAPIRLFVLALFYLVGAVHSSEFNGTCETTDSLSIPAYTHWPFRVDCDHLKEIWRERDEATDGDSLECDVVYNGTRSGEGIFKLQDMTSITPKYRTELVINNTKCISSNVDINLRPFPEDSCVDSLNAAASRDELIDIEATIGDPVELRCIPPEGSPVIIPNGVNIEDFDTIWYTRCTNDGYRNNNLWSNLEDEDGYPKKLNMPRVDFYDATNFTCTVTYDGRTLYVRTYAQCIKQRTKHTDPTITCTSIKTEPPGEQVALDCTGQIVLGVTKSEDFLVEWNKDDKVICTNQIFNQSNEGLHDPSRQSCLMEDQTRNRSVDCVVNGFDIPEDEIQDERKAVDIYYKIKDLKDSDYGKYMVSIKVRQDGIWKNDTWAVELKEDLTPFYERLTIILAAILVVLLVFIAAGVLIRRYKIYILVAYKRSRLRKYDRDDKEYVVYLSYHYDASLNTSSQAVKNLKATERIVYAIQNLMDKYHYKYYDEQRECDFSAQVETITNLVEKCHRMVLVLTPAYLDDKWKRFHAELGFHGLLESRIGLVFILTPGVKKLLERRARNDRVWERLLIAIKTNRVIKWNDTMSDDELKNYVEYSLPKLARKPRTSSRNGSYSEEAECNGHQYDRSISQNTTCTNLSPDVAPNDAML